MEYGNLFLLCLYMCVCVCVCVCESMYVCVFVRDKESVVITVSSLI